jgi:hypothetical protein
MPVLILRYDTGNRGLANATAPGGQQNEWATNPSETFPAIQKVWREMKAGLNAAHIGVLSGFIEGVGGALCAQGSITLGSTITGAVGATVGGTLVTVTAVAPAAGNNYVSATALLLLAAFRANAALSNLFSFKLDAYNVGDESGDFTAKVLVTYLWPGVAGNAATLVASGTGVTVSGATLAGGAASSVVQPLISAAEYFAGTG